MLRSPLESCRKDSVLIFIRMERTLTAADTGRHQSTPKKDDGGKLIEHTHGPPNGKAKVCQMSDPNNKRKLTDLGYVLNTRKPTNVKM
mmetsp:Transcript_41467/g.61366  ORF Transcript_41467/g.61366 Transcript_41467/m.61366 type:complete len:88 (-) Transcript_41467:468-731(-)